MTVNETSLIAWGNLQGKLSGKRLEVWEMLKQCRVPVTNAELAKLLKWPINCVTGRVSELKKHGIIETAGRRKCHATGGTASTIKVYEGAKHG